MLIVNAPEQHHGFAHVPGLGMYLRDAILIDIARDASRNHGIHEIAVTEQRMAHAQPVFAQPRELCEPERKPRVIAEKAQVPQVLPDALALEE